MVVLDILAKEEADRFVKHFEGQSYERWRQVVFVERDFEVKRHEKVDIVK